MSYCAFCFYSFCFFWWSKTFVFPSLYNNYLKGPDIISFFTHLFWLPKLIVLEMTIYNFHLSHVNCHNNCGELSVHTTITAPTNCRLSVLAVLLVIVTCTCDQIYVKCNLSNETVKITSKIIQCFWQQCYLHNLVNTFCFSTTFRMRHYDWLSCLNVLIK